MGIRSLIISGIAALMPLTGHAQTPTGAEAEASSGLRSNEYLAADYACRRLGQAGHPISLVNKKDASLTLVFLSPGCDTYEVISKTPVVLGKNPHIDQLQESEMGGTTPAGYYVAETHFDPSATEQDPYQYTIRFLSTADRSQFLSLHGVVRGREEAFNSASTADNYLSWGCVNVPKAILMQHFNAHTQADAKTLTLTLVAILPVNDDINYNKKMLDMPMDYKVQPAKVLSKLSPPELLPPQGQILTP